MVDAKGINENQWMVIHILFGASTTMNSIMIWTGIDQEERDDGYQ